MSLCKEKPIFTIRIFKRIKFTLKNDSFKNYKNKIVIEFPVMQSFRKPIRTQNLPKMFTIANRYNFKMISS